MTNNIFNKAENKIFYIKIDGEVYEMKFENIVLPMHGVLLNNLGKVTMSDKAVVTIRVNIASLGEKLWYRHQFESELPITQIYETLDDCIKGVHPIFKYGNYGCIKFTSVIAPIIATTDEVLMDGAYWRLSKNFYEEEVLTMRTYHWNGIEAISKRVYAPNTEETKDLVFHNSDEFLHYDLVNEKHIVDSEYQKKCYATYEECVNDNVVKIHRF